MCILGYIYVYQAYRSWGFRLSWWWVIGLDGFLGCDFVPSGCGGSRIPRKVVRTCLCLTVRRTSQQKAILLTFMVEITDCVQTSRVMGESRFSSHTSDVNINFQSLGFWESESSFTILIMYEIRIGILLQHHQTWDLITPNCASFIPVCLKQI